MLHVRADDSKRGVAHVFRQLLAQFDADTPLALISSFLSNAAIGCLLIRICCFMMLGFNVSNSAGTVMEVVQACEGFPRAFMLVVTGGNLSCFAYMTFVSKTARTIGKQSGNANTCGIGRQCVKQERNSTCSSGNRTM